MRNSINYNLNYFIMRMSGTKPMKNTMRKPSPLKDAVITASLATKEGRASYEASRPKGAGGATRAARDAARSKSTGSGTVKSGLRGLAGQVRGLAGRTKEKVAEKQALKAKQPTQTTKSTPPVEGKPSRPKPAKTISKAPTDAKSAAVKPAASASKGAPAAASGGVFQLRKHKR
jgi:hypothetical protein